MLKKALSLAIVICFFITTLVGPLPQAHAAGVLDLPQPGRMINLTPAYEPVIIKGITVHRDNPFLFDFIVDIGQDRMSGKPLKKEGEKLIKYFLAGLAIPDKDLWVNLSPYEKNKMIPQALGQTDMGRDLLEQDYILKQITASLIYPEKQLGRTFWDKVYAKSQKMYGTTQVPVNTFNKVWIMADKAEIFEHNQTAFVVGCHLKVMLEEDYLALSKHQQPRNHTHSIASQIIKEIVLPELEKEVNGGKNFANLRQIFNSVILSSWYKKNLKKALLNQLYADRSKIKGIDLNDPTIKERIYEQYIKAYKKGVFNYIKEDVNAAGTMVPRKYFSGGEIVAVDPVVITDLAMGTRKLADVLPPEQNRLRDFSIGVRPNAPLEAQGGNPSAAMMTREELRQLANSPLVEKRRAGPLSQDPLYEVLSHDIASFLFIDEQGLIAFYAGGPDTHFWGQVWGRDTWISALGLVEQAKAGETLHIYDARTKSEKEIPAKEVLRRLIKLWAGIDGQGRQRIDGKNRDGDIMYNVINWYGADNKNTADAPLWFIKTVYDYIEGTHDEGFLKETVRPNGQTLLDVLWEITDRYRMVGVDLHRWGMPDNSIQSDPQTGLIYVPHKVTREGWNKFYTWSDTEFTPRQGYPVEIQGLAVEAFRHVAQLTLKIDASRNQRALELLRHADKINEEFLRLFQTPDGYLYDDLGTNGFMSPAESMARDWEDPAFRANQLLAILSGVVPKAKARELLKLIRRKLALPGAVASLADEPTRFGRFFGDFEEAQRAGFNKNAAYHSGMGWVWLYPLLILAEVQTGLMTPQEGDAQLHQNLGPIVHYNPAHSLPELLSYTAYNGIHARRGPDRQAWSVGVSVYVLRSLEAMEGNAAMTVNVKYENGVWDIVIGAKTIQTLDIVDLAKKLEEALIVNIKTSGNELEIYAPSRTEPFKVDATDAVKLKDTIDEIARNTGALTAATAAPANNRIPIAITNESFPILSAAIKASGNGVESSLKGRLTTKYGLATAGDSFKSIVMGASEGKTDFELARQIIKTGQIEPKKDWARDQWYALKLFVAMRYVLYQEFNTSSGERYIPNGPVESVIIDYLGSTADNRDIAKFAQKIAQAYQLDPVYRESKIDWSAFQQSFEEFLQAAESLYDGLKSAYSEALAQQVKEMAVIHHAASTSNGGAPQHANGSNGAVDQLPDVLTVITDARKSSLTGVMDPHLVDVPASENNAVSINAANRHYQLEMYNHLRHIFGFGAVVSQDKLTFIWAALNGQLPMDRWGAFEKDILPNPSNPGEPNRDRQDRILTFMSVYTLLRQPLDSEGKERSVLSLDTTFLARVKGLFNPANHISEATFRGGNSLMRLDGFFKKVPQGTNKVDDYWWKPYSTAVIATFGDKSKGSSPVVATSPAPVGHKAAPAVASATVKTAAVANATVSANILQDFRAKIEAISHNEKGPFYPLTSDMVKLIWPRVVEPEETKAIDEWKSEIEPKLPADKKLYYRAAFAVVRTLYHQEEKELTLKADDKAEGKVIRFIYLLAKRTAGNEGRLDENIPGLRGTAGNILAQLDAAMETRVLRHKIAFPGGIDLNTTNGMLWKVSKDGHGVEMNIDPAMVQRIRREGINSLSPVIFKITPITNIWSFVGLKEIPQEHLAAV